MFLTIVNDPASSAPSPDHQKQKQNQIQIKLPKFKIRDYVFNSRSKNIAKNWPFEQKYLEHLLKHGIKNPLPTFAPYDHLPGDSIQAVETSGTKLLLHPDLRANSNFQQIGLIDDGQVLTEKDDQPAKLSSTELEHDQELVLQDSCRLSKPTSSCLGVVERQVATDLPEVLAEDIQGLDPPSSPQKMKEVHVSDPSLIEEGTLSDAMAGSKICPVCQTFTSSSNTKLNAHIDQCLSADFAFVPVPNYIPRHRKTSKRRVKFEKLRSMSEINAHAIPCTLEELDIRNGSTWNVESSLPRNEIRQQRCTPIDIEDVLDAEENNIHGAVYVNSSGKKLRKISKFSEGSIPTLGESSNAVNRIRETSEALNHTNEEPPIREHTLDCSNPLKHSRETAKAVNHTMELPKALKQSLESSNLMKLNTETSNTLKRPMLTKHNMDTMKHSKESSKALNHNIESSDVVKRPMLSARKIDFRKRSKDSTNALMHSTVSSKAVKHRRKGDMISSDQRNSAQPELSARAKHKYPNELSLLEPTARSQVVDIPRQQNAMDEILVKKQSPSYRLRARDDISRSDSSVLRQQIYSKGSGTSRKLSHGTNLTSNSGNLSYKAKDNFSQRSQPTVSRSQVEMSHVVDCPSSLRNLVSSHRNRNTCKEKFGEPTKSSVPFSGSTEKLVLSSKRRRCNGFLAPPIPFPKRRGEEVCPAPVVPSPKRKIVEVFPAPAIPNPKRTLSKTRPASFKSSDGSQTTSTDVNDRNPFTRKNKVPSDSRSGSLVGLQSWPNTKLNENEEPSVLENSRVNRFVDETDEHSGRDVPPPLGRKRKGQSTFSSASVVRPSWPNSKSNMNSAHLALKKSRPRISLDGKDKHAQPPVARKEKGQSTFRSGLLVSQSWFNSKLDETRELMVSKEVPVQQSLDEVNEDKGDEQQLEKRTSNTSRTEVVAVLERQVSEPRLCTFNSAPLDFSDESYDELSLSDTRGPTCSSDIQSDLVPSSDNLPEPVDKTEALVPITVERLYENELECGGIGDGYKVYNRGKDAVPEVEEKYSGGHPLNSSPVVQSTRYGADLVPKPGFHVSQNCEEMSSWKFPTNLPPTSSRGFSMSPISASSAIFHPPATRNVHLGISCAEPQVLSYPHPSPIYREAKYHRQQSMASCYSNISPDSPCSLPNSVNSEIINPILGSPRYPLFADQSASICTELRLPRHGNLTFGAATSDVRSPTSTSVIRLMGKDLVVANDDSNVAAYLQLSSTAVQGDSSKLPVHPVCSGENVSNLNYRSFYPTVTSAGSNSIPSHSPVNLQDPYFKNCCMSSLQ